MCFPNFGTARTQYLMYYVYTNDSPHGVCFPTVIHNTSRLPKSRFHLRLRVQLTAKLSDIQVWRFFMSSSIYHFEDLLKDI